MKTRSFQTRILMSFTIINVVVVLFVFVFLWISLYRQNNERLEDSVHSAAINSVAIVDQTLSEMDRIAIEVAASPFVQDYMKRNQKNGEGSKKAYTQSENNAFSTLISITAGAMDIKRLNIYNSKGYCLSIGAPTYKNKTEQYLNSDDFLKRYRENSPARGRKIVRPPQEDYWDKNHDGQVVSLYRSIIDVNTFKMLGVVEVQFDAVKFANRVSIESGFYHYLFTSKGELVFSNDDEAQNTVGSLMDRTSNQDKLMVMTACEREGHPVRLLLAKCKEENWYYGILVPNEINIFSARNLSVTVLCVTLAMILCGFLMTLYASRRLSMPIRELKDTAVTKTRDQSGIDEQAKENASCRCDEIVQINRAFDTLYSTLCVSKENLAYTKLQETKAQLLAIQAQMTPHFIFNTLSVVSALAQMYEAEDIMKICRRLAGMMRYSACYSSKHVTVGEELEHAINYLELMSCRFTDCIAYDVQVREEDKEIKVPRLILQPIVENCFQHGLKNSRTPWIIKVGIRTDGQCWRMEITDNGSGCEEALANEINAMGDVHIDDVDSVMHSLSIGGNGLLNIYTRLRIAYKDQAILHIRNNSDKGCTVTIGGSIL